MAARLRFWPLGVGAVAATLSGCAGQPETAHIYPGLFGQTVVGNETYVTVGNVWSDSDALPLAEKHCRAYNKAARFNHMDGPRAVFDCVPAGR